MKLTPLSSAAFSAASASRSETSPQSAPIAQAPKPIGLTCQPVRLKGRCCMVGVSLVDQNTHSSSRDHVPGVTASLWRQYAERGAKSQLAPGAFDRVYGGGGAQRRNDVGEVLHVLHLDVDQDLEEVGRAVH